MSEAEPWLFHAIPDRGGLALDIGANAGEFTALLADRFDSVHAFEPNPQVHETLRRRTAPLDNVRLFEAAVGERCRDVGLHLYGRHECASFYTDADLDTAPRGEDVDAVRTVPMLALDDIGYPARVIDFIKIDVEGAECRVLQGAERTLRKRPALLIEIHSFMNWEWCGVFLMALRYSIERIPHPNPDVAKGHCWIVARAQP